jgi:hypothetical protein
VTKSKYLKTPKNKNCLHEEIKSRLNSVNACYHLTENIFFSHLLSKNTNIKTHAVISLPLVLYGFETLTLRLREEHRLRVFENRVLRKICWLYRKNVTGN